MWLYKGEKIKNVKTLGSDIHGFVYKITDLKLNKIYIGKKILFTNRKKRLTKKEQLDNWSGKGRKPRFKREIKESNWLDYYGSSKTLLEEINRRGELEFRREILILCKSKKSLTYWEIHHQCINNVLLIDSYNDTILGRFFKKDLI